MISLSITSDKAIKAFNTVPWLSLFKWTTLIFFCLVLSFLIATGSYIVAAVLMAIIVLPIFTKLAISMLGAKHDVIFWLLFATIMFSSLGAAITRSSLSFVATGILLAASPIIILSVYQESKLFGRIKLPLFLILSFYIVGIISSFTGRSAFFPAMYSLVMSLKPILLLAIGACFIWTDRTQRNFSLVLKWSWVPLLLVGLIQWFSPRIFLLLIPDADLSPDPNPFFPGFSRASSLFAQSSVLAAYASIVALILVAEAMIKDKKYAFLNSSFYFLLLLMSGQRQELLAFMVCIPFIFIMYRFGPSLFSLSIFAILGLGTALSAIFFLAPEMFRSELSNWDFSGATGLNLSARAALYSDAINLAGRYWPWGTGFGTFASVGAVKFDQSLYVDLGYRAFWWYIQQKSWLMDAYWAKYIAESGWIGFVFTLLFYVTILNKIVSWIRDPLVRKNNEVLYFCVLAFTGLFYVLATSPTAFNLAEPHGGLLPLMFIGIAWQRVNKLRAASEELQKSQIK